MNIITNKLRLAEVLSSTGDRDCRYYYDAVDSTDHVDDESLYKTSQYRECWN